MFLPRELLCLPLHECAPGPSKCSVGACVARQESGQTRNDVLRPAQVDEQVAANAPQASLEVKHRLENELGTECPSLGVAVRRQGILP